MIVHRWGVVEYSQAMRRMRDIHKKAYMSATNHLIVCSHPAVFTVGSAHQNRHFGDLPLVVSDRGGSITCHSEGQSVFYFCFEAHVPARFFKKVVTAFESFFKAHLKAVRYDKARPGFYIDNRKIASLGFRYENGYSLHGVAVNVDVDLAFHAQAAPCGLEGVTPTSLSSEGSAMTQNEVEEEIVRRIKEAFYEAL